MAEADRAALRERVRALFVGELDEGIRALNEGVVRLSRTSGDEHVSLIRELFRVAHGLKGSALAAEIPEAAQRARAIEAALDEIRNGLRTIDEQLVTELLAVVDSLDLVRSRLSGPPDGHRTTDADTVVADEGVEAPPAPGRRDVRVSAAKLDSLVDRAAEIAAASELVASLARGLVESSASSAAGPTSEGDRSSLAEAAVRTSRELSRLSAELTNAAAELTFQPVREAYEGLARAVHDLARDTGKEVELDLRGGDVELDREVVATLREPLLHLVRNAVAHGIEAPDERMAVGKQRSGRVVVDARMVDGRLSVEVTDDGRGLDRDSLRIAARRSGRWVHGVDEAELAFAPGVSTSQVVSDASGRGVGLDAVRARMRAIGGDAFLLSEPGRGTTVTLRSPVTLALLDVLHVRCGEEVAYLPTSAIDHVVRVPRSELQDTGGRVALLQGGSTYPVVDLGRAAGLTARAPVLDEVVNLALVGDGRPVALAVDELLGESEVVVKKPPARLGGAPAVLGVAVRPDGGAVLVLNPTACATAALSPGADTAAPAPEEESWQTRVLLAEDTFTTRVLEVGILEGAGYAVTAVADGAEAWELLQREQFDVLVTDVHMPGLDGFELTRRVRAHDGHADLPVVLVTSLGTPEDRARGLDAGASAYVVKSELGSDTLPEVIERLL